MNERYLEKESDAPADWQSNVIYRRNANGLVFVVDVPDDTEGVDENVGDD